MAGNQDIDKELRFHIDARVDDLIASGVPPDEAQRQARLELGGITQTRERVRDLRLLALADGLLNDMRLAIRSLRATPIVSFVAIMSLALGIGANTAIFSIVDSLLLRALPVAEPQRLAVVSNARGVAAGSAGRWTFAIWDQIRQRSQPFDGACAWASGEFNLTPGGGEIEPVDGIFATGDYFSVLGTRPLLGRTFTAADDVAGGARDGPVAVISYRLWQERFAGSGAIIGSPIVVSHVPFTIIGVTGPSFFGAEIGRSVDITLPMQMEPVLHSKDSWLSPQRSYYALTVLLRLKPSQSLDDATAIMRGMQPAIRTAAIPATLPTLARQSFLADPFVVVPAASGTSRMRARYERPLLAIFVVVALVLLIACGNLANLQLAKTAARQHELSVRLALGASQWRIVRQWLIESLALSVAGAAMGLLFASWSVRLLMSGLQTTTNRVYLDLAIDWRVLAFTGGIAIATTILFGTVPAFRATRVPPIGALTQHGRASANNGRVGVSGALVACQLALSLIIVVAAALFVRTFENLATVALGFDSDRVLLVNVDIAGSHVAIDDRLAFFGRLADRIRDVPGVEKASASMLTPTVDLGMVDVLRLPGRPATLEGFSGNGLNDQSTFVNIVTAGWFATYGTAIKAGRDFNAGDVKGSPAVIIVNEAFVRKFLGGREPVGATVDVEMGRGAASTRTIVGVVGDSTYRSLRLADAPIEYVPLTQFPAMTLMPTLAISVRATSDSPMLLTRRVTAALTGVDPDLMFSFRLLTEQVGATLVQERLVATLSGFFGALALLLAGLGLYGVTAYAVVQRRMELGIRMALGSTSTGIVQLVLSRLAVQVGAGIAIGISVSLWASRFIASLLYGLAPRDPGTLVGAVVVLVSVVVIAGWLPAYRASRIDPARVLRES